METVVSLEQLKQAEKPQTALYGLATLRDRPERSVICTDSEAAVDAGQVLLPGSAWVCVKSDSDLKPMTGRLLLLWPIHGKEAAKLLSLKPKLLAIARKLHTISDKNMPDGWDAAMALARGWTEHEVDQWIKSPGVLKAETPAEIKAEDKRDRASFALWGEIGIPYPNGKPITNMDTVVRILESGQHKLGNIHFDKFKNNVIIDDQSMEDAHRDDLLLYCQRDLQLHKLGKEAVRDGLVTFARHDVRNCLLDWLYAGPEWDGQRRCKDFFRMFYGAEHNQYTACAGINFFRSMVVRALNPGCQQDHMIVLEGPQGIGKSTSLKIICPTEWFSVTHSDIMHKDFLINMQGKWLIEIDEMHSFNRAEISAVKSAISRTTDRFREPYGICSRDFPRQACFIGTTNRNDWNKDDTGARRFWPICCTRIYLDALKLAVPQLFAEALHDIQDGKPYWKMPLAETRAEQQLRYDYHPWHEPVAEWVSTRTAVTTLEVLTLCIKIPLERCLKREEMAVASILRNMGWKPRSGRQGSKRVNMWERPDAEEDARPVGSDDDLGD